MKETIELQNSAGEIVNIANLPTKQAEDVVVARTKWLMSRVHDGISMDEALRQCFRLGIRYKRVEFRNVQDTIDNFKKDSTI